MIRALFRALRTVGDVKAIRRGRYPQRPHRGLARFMRRRGL